jgi:hypothetical protein
VIIPAGVTSIGDRAFSGNQLTNVTIPSGVTSIGDRAFWQNQLTSVTIPSGVTSIGAYAFSENQLISVTIPSGVTSIGAGAFRENQLTSVTVPSSVTSIGGGVFSGNPLTSITIASGVRLLNLLDDDTFGRAYSFGGRRQGTYVFQGSAWMLDGIDLSNPVTLMAGENITVTKIDDKALLLLQGVPNTPSSYQLPGGRHSITVKWEETAKKRAGVSYEYTGELNLDRYLTPGRSYTVTGEEAEGNKIRFRVVEQSSSADQSAGAEQNEAVKQ